MIRVNLSVIYLTFEFFFLKLLTAFKFFSFLKLFIWKISGEISTNFRFKNVKVLNYF